MVVKRPEVLRRGGRRGQGKGFSPEEFKKAGLSLTEAVKLHVPVDPRRKTAYEENVKVLKASLEEKRAAVKSKKRKGKSKS